MKIATASSEPDPYATYRARYTALMAATATAFRKASRFGGRR